MARLYYQGHGSFRITADNGTVIYVDPYAGDGYEKPGDVILVTHQHGDHNQVGIVSKKDDCRIITNEEALGGEKYNTFSVKGVDIEAVAAGNSNHNPRECVGYLITVDGVRLYAAGDTSKTEQMETFAERNINYALLPIDGIYNMNPDEAAECAKLIGAGHNIPIHMKPKSLFDRSCAEMFCAPNRLIVEPGQEIEL